MDLIEDIGPILGIVAFLGFAVLALLIVLQARDVRRLREWAGRAPERSLEADEAVQAVAVEEDGESGVEPEEKRGPGLRERAADSFAYRWQQVDRRSPVDPRWLLAVAAAGLIAVAVVTSGFGLVGGDDSTERRAGSEPRRQGPVEVAVLNATQVEDDLAPVPAVSGLADAVAQQVVEPAGFDVARTGDAPSGFEATVVMYEPEAERQGQRLANRVSEDLGDTAAEPMTDEIRSAARRSELALIVGQDDAGFGGLGSDATAVP